MISKRVFWWRGLDRALAGVLGWFLWNAVNIKNQFNYDFRIKSSS